MTKPLVSAVMLVYNGEKYLCEAIDSVLAQSFRDFELIIINDGSADRSLDIIKQYTDGRIRLINNAANLGIPYCRNIGLREAKGEFLAWCDADDINFTCRFEEQVNFLKSNGKYGVCGAWQMYFWGRRYRVNKTKKEPELVKAMLLFKPSIMNPTAMLRLSMIHNNNLSYNTRLAIGEDYELLLRSSMCFPLTNVQKLLVKYRASETSIMKKFESKEIENDKIHHIIYAQGLSYLGINAGEPELMLHRLASSGKKFDGLTQFQSCYNWLINLQLKNADTRTYDPKALNSVLATRFYVISKKASVYGIATFKYYLKRSYPGFGYMRLQHVLKLAFLCIVKNTIFKKADVKK